MTESITATLTETGALTSVPGTLAVLLARRLDAGVDAGSAHAALITQLERAMAWALRPPPGAPVVDDLRERRRRRLTRSKSGTP